MRKIREFRDMAGVAQPQQNGTPAQPQQNDTPAQPQQNDTPAQPQQNDTEGTFLRYNSKITRQLD